MLKIVGPFDQILTMGDLPLNGPIRDSEMQIVKKGGVLVEDNLVVGVDKFDRLKKKNNIEIEEIPDSSVLLPGLIDSHTHICYSGTRAHDFAKKLEGKTYQQIFAEGGGINDTVNKTRKASFNKLRSETSNRVERHFYSGVTTMEIKSGYGLSRSEEIKMLEVIASINRTHPADLVPTCLAAHTKPKEFDNNKSYLNYIISDILPEVLEKGLTHRIDIFIEKNAFGPEEAEAFLIVARKMGFLLTVHADQFSKGGSRIAAAVGALSADHLEVSGPEEIRTLIERGVIAIVLPGASLGLGMPFAPARKFLDEGACLAIASDWNPGSAPMGDLLIASSILSNYEKLSFAETFAGLTYRSASALRLKDRGIIGKGKLADMISFPTNDYRDILYNQGMLRPDMIWKNGDLYFKKNYNKS